MMKKKVLKKTISTSNISSWKIVTDYDKKGRPIKSVLIDRSNGEKTVMVKNHRFGPFILQVTNEGKRFIVGKDEDNCLYMRDSNVTLINRYNRKGKKKTTKIKYRNSGKVDLYEYVYNLDWTLRAILNLTASRIDVVYEYTTTTYLEIDMANDIITKYNRLNDNIIYITDSDNAFYTNCEYNSNGDIIGIISSDERIRRYENIYWG